MQIIGFNFTKMAAEKIGSNVSGKPNISIQFTDITSEKHELLADKEAVKVAFTYDLNYESSEKKDKAGAISFAGEIVLAMETKDSKEVQKSWSKKKLPTGFKVPLFNLILRKCTPKSIMLQDELNLPFHTPMPKLSPSDTSQ